MVPLFPHHPKFRAFLYTLSPLSSSCKPGHLLSTQCKRRLQLCITNMLASIFFFLPPQMPLILFLFFFYRFSVTQIYSLPTLCSVTRRTTFTGCCMCQWETFTRKSEDREKPRSFLDLSIPRVLSLAAVGTFPQCQLTPDSFAFHQMPQHLYHLLSVVT